jgi:hypothetical protein
VQHERGALRQCIELVDRLTKRRRDVLFASFAKPMWLSLTCAKKMLFRSVSERNGRRLIAKDFEHRPAIPQTVAVSSPRHAPQEASTIDAVVAEVRRDIVAAGRTRISVFVEPVVVAIVMMAHLNLSPGFEV